MTPVQMPLVGFNSPKQQYNNNSNNTFSFVNELHPTKLKIIHFKWNRKATCPTIAAMVFWGERKQVRIKC